MENNYLAKISAAEAKNFLMELANLNVDDIGRFQKRFGKLIPNNSVPFCILTRDREGNQISRPYTEEEKKESEESQIIELRNLVRKVWVQPDLRTKRYGVFLLWKYAMFSLNRVEPGIPSWLPPPSPFEQAIQFLMDGAEFARYCGNAECFAPYFFASRRNQKYCSDACSVPAQREFKRKWWAEHGEEWRGSRTVKKSSKKKTKKKER